jgi:hypothetical protein
MSEAARVDLSVIIVSWNVRELLSACLDSCLKQSSASHLTLEVIVVDSASSDGTAAFIAERYPQVKLLAQDRNVGFTAGNNIGLRLATGRYLLLLNPDTLILDDALSQMVAYLDAHPQIGAIGPQTHNPDGSIQSTRRRFPTVATGIFESTWLQRFAPRRLLDHYYATDIADEAIAEVDWVQGSALMVRHEVYTQIGGLDEAYIMFSEEMDWCKRIKAAGWGVIYLGNAHITHYGGQSTEQVTTRKHILFQQSKLHYFRKHHGRLAGEFLRVFLLLSYIEQWIMESIKVTVGYKRAMQTERRNRAQTYRQVIRALAGRF